MKHIFILNPAAGKGKAEKNLLPKIIAASKRLDIDYEIHRTMGRGDAENFVRGRCKTLQAVPISSAQQVNEELLNKEMINAIAEPESCRFYVCGGDGTLNEVVNGASGFEFAEIAVIPAGTGNDFIRNFKCPEKFLDIEAQIKGTARKVDAIRYRRMLIDYDGLGLGQELDEIFLDEDNAAPWRYGINMFNIGLDADVVVKASELKKHPFVLGTAAYGVGIAMVLGRKDCIDLDVEFDDGTSHRGKIMLIAIANGCFCGGGYKGVPLASLDDGLIDVSIVKNVSRRTFLKLLGKYKKGTHLDDPATKDIITYKKCKSLTIITKKEMQIAIDGEIVKAGPLRFEIIPNAVKFSVPQGCE